MFGFWVRTSKAYSAQCPACEQTQGVKHIEALFNGVNRYLCKLCGCTWMYRKGASHGEYVRTMERVLPEVLTT